MFSQKHYDFNGIDGRLLNGALLYRCSSAAWCSPELIVNGLGPVEGNTSGRFHFAQQPTTYCANNVLTSMAEVLYHMYRRALESLRLGHPVKHIEATVERKLCLVVFRVSDIPSLACVDCEDFRREYGAKLSGTMVVHPDSEYDEFQKLSTRMRQKEKRGVIYPSARHSMDHCLALFRNETRALLAESVHSIPLFLRLVTEDQSRDCEPVKCLPHIDKIDPIQGFYRFETEDLFRKLSDEKLFNPANLPACGYIDFARRRYVEYPRHAVATPGVKAGS